MTSNSNSIVPCAVPCCLWLIEAKSCSRFYQCRITNRHSMSAIMAMLAWATRFRWKGISEKQNHAHSLFMWSWSLTLLLLTCLKAKVWKGALLSEAPSMLIRTTKTTFRQREKHAVLSRISKHPSSRTITGANNVSPSNDQIVGKWVH